MWELGSLIILVVRIFLAGMNGKKYFYKDVRKDYGDRATVSTLDEYSILGYCGITAVLVLLWPIALPAYGVYLLGKRYAK